MTRIDPRIAARRRAVQETQARRSLGQLFVVLAVLAVVAGVVWAFRSPLLSVSAFDVEGASRSDVLGALAASGVAEGVPMMDLDLEAAATSIEADPWVVSSVVARDWPGTVTVTVVERVPVGWVRTVEGWQWVAADGGVVGSGDTPELGSPVLVAVDRSRGDLPSDAGVRGMLVFMGELRDDLAQTAVITAVDGGFEATIGGYEVRLGTGEEPAAKAASVAALIDQAPEPGSVLTVMAPLQPAVLPPSAVADEPDAGEAGDVDAENPEGG
jgi:cell division protein FtsQ